jgi:hypothetical protein
MLALRAAGKESSGLLVRVAAKHELILVPMAKGAGFPL